MVLVQRGRDDISGWIWRGYKMLPKLMVDPYRMYDLNIHVHSFREKKKGKGAHDKCPY